MLGTATDVVMRSRGTGSTGTTSPANCPQSRAFDEFDLLATALFDDKYRVVRAALIPSAVVADRSTYVEHTSSYK